MSTDDVVGAVSASSLSELCWVDDRGRPRVRGVVALVRDGRPALAFHYADHVVAREVGRAARVTLALSEPRSTGSRFQPLLLTGVPRLLEDPSGELFVTELLVQELRRYPPSRVFADSPLLMREHWWYLPRLVVEIDLVAVEPLPVRTPPHDHLLVGVRDASPVVRVAAVVLRGEDRLELDVQGGPVPPGAALVFGQDASFPDLERWSQWRYTGTWEGRALTVEEAPARIGLAPPLGLIQRWRRQRALERACVKALPR